MIGPETSPIKVVLAGLLVLGIAVGAGAGAIWSASTGSTITRDQEVWERGLPANGSIDGTRQSKRGLAWLIATYHVAVHYTDAEGAVFEGESDILTMFGAVDTGQTALRYDPRDHGRFAVSWAVEASGARWRAAIILTLLLALIALVSVYGVSIIFRNARTGMARRP